MAASAEAWLRWYARPPAARRALICFPPAGGAASFYRSWAEHLPADLAMAAVQYPGRENRLAEPALADLHLLVGGVHDAVMASGDLTVALFGHSLGAAVAFESAYRLPRVDVLFVSGAAPPAVHVKRQKRVWTSEAVLDDLRRLGGPNQAVLAHPALQAVVLPALMADYQLTENYQPSQTVSLECPVVAFNGAADSEVTGDEMLGWGRITTGAFGSREFAGDHFFPQRHAADVVAAIAAMWRAFTPAAPR